MSLELEGIYEKCAVTAAMTSEPNAAHLAYLSLYALQHRGVEASGIATEGLDGDFKLHRSPGMVKDVYDPTDLEELASTVAIGHNRYSTDGSKKRHMQPVQDARIGFAMATNGNLPVTQHLETYLEKNHVRTDKLNDSEKKALAIAQHVRNGHDLPDAVELSQHLFRGSYSTVALHDGVIVAFRDPKGIRPLEIGELDGTGGTIVASETCALDTVGAIKRRSILPGEMVVITPDGVESRQLAEGEEKLDIFEFVYFARPDSYLYGENVGVVRRRLGEQLAEEHATLAENKDALVVPVPETAVPIAEGFAKKLGLELTNSAVVKSRFVGRTFMLESQELRKMYLDLKLSLIKEFVQGRDLIFVDDSIVRLNTARVIVQKAHTAGAKSVSFLSASPPIRWPDYYGIDTPHQQELAAATMTVEQIRKEIDAKYLGYLPLSRMIAATAQPESRFNLAAFTGVYPIGIGHHKQKLFTPAELTYLD